MHILFDLDGTLLDPEVGNPRDFPEETIWVREVARVASPGGFLRGLDERPSGAHRVSKELIDFLIKSVGSEFGRSIFTKEFKAQQAASSDTVK